MNDLISSTALWLADFGLLSAVLLTLALVTLVFVNQPAGRLAITKSTLLALFLLAALCTLPGWSLMHLLSPQQRPNGSPVPASTIALDTSTPQAPAFNSELPSPTSPSPNASVTPPAPSFEWRDLPWLTLAVSVYATGSACVVVWLCLGALAAHRLVRAAQPAPDQLVALLEAITASDAPVCHWLRQSYTSLRRKTLAEPVAPMPERAQLLASPNIDVPVALGVFCPTILLPRAFIESQSAIRTEFTRRGGQSEIQSVLAHEAAHLRNHDLHWLAVSRVLLVLLWPQPLYWLLRRRMRLDQETLADAAAAEHTSRQHYAEQLVTWARNMTPRPAVRLSSAVGLWEGPSQLRQRIALLIDEHITILKSCSRTWRIVVTTMTIMAALLLSLVTLAPQSAAQTKSNNPSPVTVTSPNDANDEIKQAAAKPVDIRIVVAKHVLLYDSKVIHWQKIEELIASLPDPKLACVHLSFTDGAPKYAKGAVREKISELEKRYGCKWGSSSLKVGRTAARYDAISSRFDIVPNEMKPDESETWRINGVVQNSDGMPVADAEVVLCPAVDESVNEKKLDIVLQNWRLHDPTDEITTHSDSSGRFVVYQSPDTPYYLLALHPDGFGLVRSDEFATSHRIEIKPWARVEGFAKAHPLVKQWAMVTLRVPAADGWPELVFSQLSTNFDQQTPDGHYKFQYVPPGTDITIKRIIGNGFLPYKEFGLRPGEVKVVDIEQPSDEEAKQLKAKGQLEDNPFDF